MPRCVHFIGKKDRKSGDILPLTQPSSILQHDLLLPKRTVKLCERITYRYEMSEPTTAVQACHFTNRVGGGGRGEGGGGGEGLTVA